MRGATGAPMSAMPPAMGSAPGAPGMPPTWSSSAKEMVGCALGRSRLWFTVGGGIVNEVYYPRIDIPQIRDLGFIIADGRGFWVEVKRLWQHTVELLGSRHSGGAHRAPAPSIPAHAANRRRLGARRADDRRGARGRCGSTPLRLARAAPRRHRRRQSGGGVGAIRAPGARRDAGALFPGARGGDRCPNRRLRPRQRGQRRRQ